MNSGLEPEKTSLEKFRVAETLVTACLERMESASQDPVAQRMVRQLTEKAYESVAHILKMMRQTDQAKVEEFIESLTDEQRCALLKFKILTDDGEEQDLFIPEVTGSIELEGHFRTTTINSRRCIADILSFLLEKMEGENSPRSQATVRRATGYSEYHVKECLQAIRWTLRDNQILLNGRRVSMDFDNRLTQEDS